MTTDPAIVDHLHEPVYRVVRRNWQNPLDTSFSQRKAADNRWNTDRFPALYCCCSVPVARAVTLDVFRYSGVEPTDLLPGFRPKLAEVSWSGPVVDVVSANGVKAAGFPDRYPAGTTKDETRQSATAWHGKGLLGVVCRSASLSRRGVSSWREPHQPWGEVALFVDNCTNFPSLIGSRDDLDWLRLDVTK